MIAVYAVCAALLGVALWLVWRQRVASDERAASVAERAAVAEAVHAIAHDLDNLFAVMMANLSAAHRMPKNELEETLTDAEHAATAARSLARALRSQALPPVVDEPIAPIVRLLVALQRRRGGVVDLRVEGDLRFSGHAADAFRIVHNLLDNAVREARTIEEGKVVVSVGDAELSIVNPVRAPEHVATRLLESGAGGTRGLGVSIARAAAERLGMKLEHAIDGRELRIRLIAETPSSGVRGSAGEIVTESEARAETQSKAEAS